MLSENVKICIVLAIMLCGTTIAEYLCVVA